jgi:hypothetical protein
MTWEQVFQHIVAVVSCGLMEAVDISFDTSLRIHELGKCMLIIFPSEGIVRWNALR